MFDVSQEKLQSKWAEYIYQIYHFMLMQIEMMRY